MYIYIDVRVYNFLNKKDRFREFLLCVFGFPASEIADRYIRARYVDDQVYLLSTA